MRKFLLAIALMAVTLTGFSQDFWSDRSVETKITYGLMLQSIGFPQVKSANMSVDYLDYSSSLSSSFGVNADFRFNNYFSIRPGIVYMGRSAGLTGVNNDNALQVPISVYEKYDFYYLEVPLDFIGHIPFSSGANIFLGAGPYLAKGMSASVKETVADNGPIKEKLKYGSNGDLKPMDYGITTAVGFQAAKGWSVGLNFDIGGTNIIQNSDESGTSSLKINTLYFNVGMSF